MTSSFLVPLHSNNNIGRNEVCSFNNNWRTDFSSTKYLTSNMNHIGPSQSLLIPSIDSHDNEIVSRKLTNYKHQKKSYKLPGGVFNPKTHGTSSPSFGKATRLSEPIDALI